MGKLKKSDIEHVAKLSNLDIKETELGSFENDLSDIVSYIENLKEVDTNNVEPTSQTTGLTNVLREDEVLNEDLFDVKDATSGTEKVHNNLFMVPMVLKDKE